MKKLIAIVTVMLFTFSMTMPAYGAFTVDGTPAVYSASVTVGGTPGVTVSFSASLKKISDDTSATSVTWPAITAGTDNWKAALQYIEVNGYETEDVWGIQIYTNNTTYTGSGDPAGLIRSDDTTVSLPMCWRVKDSKLSSGSLELGISEGTSGGYTVLYDSVVGHQPGGASEYFPWFFMLDKGTLDVDVTTAGNQAFGNYQDEATFIGSKGYHHAPGKGLNYVPPANTTTTYYLYLGAKYTLALPGKTYSTSTITVEMYHL